MNTIAISASVNLYCNSSQVLPSESLRKQRRTKRRRTPKKSCTVKWVKPSLISFQPIPSAIKGCDAACGVIVEAIKGKRSSCECFASRYATFNACGVAGYAIFFDSNANLIMGLGKEKRASEYWATLTPKAQLHENSPSH